jgi:penicillin-binding protein 1A
MGVESPLEVFKTTVLGTSGMTVMDQATGYGAFASGGFAGLRHGITQLTTHSGEVVYDWERDAPAPKRVLSEEALAAMNSILVQIPEWGTARRAALPGIRSAGKTGTTQSYRDAWYVGFTGNYTAAVWLGNDDFSPTNDMTGGSLPAMVWQRLMAYAHQNIELKPIPGIENPFVDPKVIAKAAKTAGEASEEASAPAIERPPLLSSTTTRVLREISETFRSAPVIEAPAEPETLSAISSPKL